MDGQEKNIWVLGAGAWGTALAQMLAQKGHRVTLYARDPGLAATINDSHENKKYLPGVPLHKTLLTTADVAGVRHAEMIVLATPAQHLRAALEKFSNHIQPQIPLINTAKGIEINSGLRLSQVAADVLPENPFAVLSGPSFAHEVAKGLPAALTLATTADSKTAAAWADSLRAPAFRPYLSDDVVGVEVAGACKNVIAIACGIVAGKKLGENARAAVMTRGMAEIRRFGERNGARAETFLGLSGIGDLTLTCHSTASRNFSLGLDLGSGRTLKQIMQDRVTVAEGVSTTQALAKRAQHQDLDLPICRAVDDILHKNADVDDVISGLLSRHIRFENE